MRASNERLPIHLRKPIRDLMAAGGRVARDGNHVLIDGPTAPADAVRAHTEELVRYVVPSVGAEEAELVRELLADAGASVAYVTAPDAARQAVAEIVAGAPDVVGLDFETEVLPAFRQPIPIKFNKDGNLAARQPRDGAAGIALDPYRSKVRLVQAWAGGEHCLRLRHAVRSLGGHRAAVRTAARHLQRGVRSQAADPRSQDRADRPHLRCDDRHLADGWPASIAR